jgi:hypothetical protein
MSESDAKAVFGAEVKARVASAPSQAAPYQAAPPQTAPYQAAPPAAVYTTTYPATAPRQTTAPQAAYQTEAPRQTQTDAAPPKPIPDSAQAPTVQVPPAPTNGIFYVQPHGDSTGTLTGFVQFQTNELTGYRSSTVIPREMNGLTITRIAPSAFMDKKLQNITIADTIVDIGDAAFAGNQLSSLVIPNSVRYIGQQAFVGSQIRGVTIGSGVILQSDSILNNFGDFYTINGKQSGTYSWNDGRWEYIAPDGTRTISGEYILPEQIRARRDVRR